ncbi:4Fe-4S binding protein [Streptosporangium sp. NPDC023825]|uniref:NuoI/complex I 23 kDa subunit family protein n=1 Tax=Streptosporangium sp. NPDC023825 TaxID=3154909 RepID=UPI003414B6D8
MLNRSVTQQYPEVRPELPPRSRGVIALVEENCTVCMLCARECPDWCIYIDSHKETLPAPEGGRPRARNMLDRFAIDFSLCMYCGICIEVCPFDALFWSPEFEYAEGDIRNLLHEKDKLAAWAQTVPPPPAHEPNADPPKELAATSRPVRPRPAPSAAGTGSGPAAGPVVPAGPGPAGGPGLTAGPGSAAGSGPTAGPGPAAGPGSAASASAPGASASPSGAPAPPADSRSGPGLPPGPGVSAPGSGTSAPDGPSSPPGPSPSGSPSSPPASPAPGTPDGPPVRRGPSSGRSSRPGTSAGHASVRAIRPPGALPKKNDPSTGGPSVEKLSTGGGEMPPAAATPEQTPSTDPSGEAEEEK